MRFGKDSEYINWIRKFKKYNISFDYDIMSNGFYIYECNGVKFKWNEQSDAYKYVRDLYFNIETLEELAEAQYNVNHIIK